MDKGRFPFVLNGTSACPYSSQNRTVMCVVCWHFALKIDNLTPVSPLPPSLSVRLLLPQPKYTLSCAEIFPFQDRFNDFQSSLSDSANLSLPLFPSRSLL